MATNPQSGQKASSPLIGDYELVSKLGEGAMGTVYKARQRSLDRMVALKLLAPQLSTDPQFLDRFKKEARASAALNHPNVVQGIDVGEAAGYHYFAMEYLDGETVRSRLDREGRLAVNDVLEIGRQTALALDYAHTKGLIHRDVKPENLMLVQDAGVMVVKLMDLGLARAIDENLSSTKTGMAIGTPYYMAPEQALGEKHLGPGCDLYALGGTMLHLLTGQPPYDGPNAAIVAAKHLAEPPPNPKAVMPSLPNPVCAILSSLLAKKPDQRYLSAAALAEDLDRVLKGGKPEHIGTGKQPPVLPRTAKQDVIGGKSRTGKLDAIASKPRTGKFDAVTPTPRGDTPKPRTGKQAEIGTGRAEPVKKPLPLAGIIGGAVAVAVIGFLAFSGKKKTDATTNTPSPTPTAPVDKPKPAPQPGDVDKEADLKREKHLEDLHKTALEVEKNSPDDLEAQRRAWQDLRLTVSDGKYATLADAKLNDIKQKLQAQIAGTLKTVTDRALALAAAHDFDGALALLQIDGAKYTQPEAQALLNSAARQLTERAQTESAALLKTAVDLEQSGKTAEALDAYKIAAQFKFAPASSQAARKVDDLAAAAEDGKMQADLTSLELFTSALTKMKGLCGQYMFDSAREELNRALLDPKLGARAQKLKAVDEALHGPEELPALVTARLAASGAQGVSVPGGKNVYFKLENGRLYFKPAADFPAMSNKALDTVKFDELIQIAGLKEPQSPALKSLPVEKTTMIGGMLALAGEIDAGRVLLARGKTAADKDVSARAAAWDEILSVLQNGEKEVKARKAWIAAESLVARKKWKEASDAYKAFLKDYATSGTMVDNTMLIQQHIAAVEKEVKVLADADAAKRAQLADAGDWTGAIDLLKLVSVRTDVQVGSWTIADGRLISDATPFAKVQLPYQPPEEYDFRIVFARGAGNGDVNQLLSHNGKPFVWKMGANQNSIFAFDKIGDQPFHNNPSTSRAVRCLVTGRKYTAVVKVRNNGVKAYLDDQLISQYKTDYSDMSAPTEDGWALSDPKSLGVGSWNSPTIFFNIDVLEISGAGKVLAKPKN